jgi:hypothetical protein
MYLTFSKFELSPLNNKKRYKLLCTFQDIFRTFQVNFQDISVTHIMLPLVATLTPGLTWMIRLLFYAPAGRYINLI